MGAVDVLDTGMYTVAGSANPTWNAVMSGEDRETFEVNGDLAHLAKAAASDALFAEFPIEAVFLGSSSDSYSQREDSRVHRPRLAQKLAKWLEVDQYFQFANACASSSYAIAAAMDAIRAGAFDVVIAGGADEVTASSVAGFTACRIYGDRCLPFSVGRKKLTLSDGAAFVVLARQGLYEEPVAKLEGAGLVSGAAHMTHMQGDGPYRALMAAFDETEDDWLDVIVAHGTGTIVNDEAESDAIVRALGVDTPAVVSYKRWLGHPQGASGAIGVVLA
ncbi:hypothetical protein LCGC14_2262050, partial [marine sediment metagenome]